MAKNLSTTVYSEWVWRGHLFYFLCACSVNEREELCCNSFVKIIYSAHRLFTYCMRISHSVFHYSLPRIQKNVPTTNTKFISRIRPTSKRRTALFSEKNYSCKVTHDSYYFLLHVPFLFLNYFLKWNYINLSFAVDIQR